MSVVFVRFLFLACLLLVFPAWAQENAVAGQSGGSLYNVLKQTYLNNPGLRASRAELRAVHEQLPQALSGYRPSISADADITYVDTENEGQSFGNQNGSNTSKQAGLNVTQPLYRGGRTLAATHEAYHSIRAQEARLLEREQDVMVAAATAYMDVLEDKALLALSENNYNVINQQLEATMDRFNVGELTRTDVSQAQARLARAEADSITARGDLKTSKAVYLQVTGLVAGEALQYPEILFPMPETLDKAVALAEKNNPAVIATQYVNAAAEENINEIYGELLPELAVDGTLSKAFDPTTELEEQRLGSVRLGASIPLYQSGAVRSRVREAKQQANQRYLEILEQRRSARQQVVAAWESFQTAQAEIKARRAQAEASKIAQEGVGYEAEFGERTILDKLDADQELLDAEVNLVTAKRNDIVSRFELAAALGLLSPQNLGFGADAIDHQSHLNRTKRKILSLDTEIDEDKR